MKLSKMDCSRGAPMGRHEHHCHDCDDIVFELEWVPFVDGCYDVGGAYWGAPDDLYCAVGTLDGEEVARFFIRASDRIEAAAAVLLDDYPGATIEPENGSLIKQAISFLEDYKVSLRVEDEGIAESVGNEIEDLQDLLEERELI